MIGEGTLILFIIVFVALLIGTYTDFKTREVPDWISYGMVLSGLGLRAVFSIINWEPWTFLHGLAGFSMFFLLALALFYAGQWGGGDAKVLMGLGALVGIDLSVDTFLFGFLVNTIVFGSLIGLVFSIALAAKHKTRMAKKAQELYQKQRKQMYGFGAISLLALVLGIALPLVRVPLLIMAALSIFTYYLLIFIRAVEQVCMIKDVEPERLTEGDWIVNDVIVGGKRICGPKDLGIEQKQIDQLITYKKKGKIKMITIKEGIPFVPSFLAGFVSMMIWGNLLFVFMNAL
ncbi:MAG: prepilin peptidase [Candidatus Nanoarchaeia archaeon]